MADFLSENEKMQKEELKVKKYHIQNFNSIYFFLYHTWQK